MEYDSYHNFIYYVDNTLPTFPTDFKSQNWPNRSGYLWNAAITVNGQTTPVDFAPPFSTVSSCFNGLSKTGNYNGIANNNRNETVRINNPVSNELTLFGVDSKCNDIKCYDALGKSYNLSLTSLTDNIGRFNTEDLAAGIYFITVNNQTLKFIKL